MAARRIARPVVSRPRHQRANGLLALLLGLLLVLSVAARADAAITWSGAQVHPHWSYQTNTSISQELQSIRDAGGNSLRMDIPWDAYEGAGDNQWNQSYLDRVGGWVTQARNLGISPIITLTGTPRGPPTRLVRTTQRRRATTGCSALLRTLPITAMPRPASPLSRGPKTCWA